MKALEKMEELQDIQRTAVIHTDSRITLDSLKNSKNYNYLIEGISQKIRILQSRNWYIDFGWVKAHAGIHGNEFADRLAKQAARIQKAVSYSKVPTTMIKHKLRKESIKKWESEWQQTTKGINTRQYFPNVSQRLAIKLPISPNFTAMLTGHGKLKACCHQFKITEDAACTCNGGDQTIDHLLLECKNLEKERNKLKTRIIEKGGRWPLNKSDLAQNSQKTSTISVMQ